MTKKRAKSNIDYSDTDLDRFLRRQQDAGSIIVKNLRNPGAAKRLRLPVTIGSSALCDITINSPAVGACSRVIFVTGDGSLRAADVTNGQDSPMESLRHFGLAVAGPFADTRNSLMVRTLQSVLASESMWFARCSAGLRKVFGQKFSQNKRLSIWFASMINVVFAINLATGIHHQDPDLSKNPLTIPYGSIVPNGFGSMSTQRSYGHGITFTVSIPHAAAAQPHTITWEGKGLEANRELTLFVNGREIFATRADKDCLATYCTLSVLIPQETLSSDRNTLFFQHAPFDSDYVVRNILVAPLTKPTAEESVAIRQSLAVARRGFEERGISHLNILSAAQELEKLKSMLSLYLGVEQLQAETNVLAKNVQDELEKLRDELWFNAAKEKQLGKLKSAKEKFESLLALSPDPASREHKKVRRQLDEIAELIK